MGRLKNTLGQILKDTSGRGLWYGALTKLATPTNLSVSNTTITFDKVENAIGYEVYADGVYIGTGPLTTGEITNDSAVLETGAGYSENRALLNSGQVADGKLII